MRGAPSTRHGHTSFAVESLDGFAIVRRTKWTTEADGELAIVQQFSMPPRTSDITTVYERLQGITHIDSPRKPARSGTIATQRRATRTSRSLACGMTTSTPYR